ncbi:MAG: shikimate dehydrogenase [Clostridia bacterium]|nr:shikimate dehydrogenase [Clostridia bacterium]
MKYGLIGGRLGHSFSKIIHERLEPDEYVLKELTPEEVAGFIRERGFEAINVTIPYKETVMPHLDEIDGAAMAIGSVNTVVNRGGRLSGYNTDLFGFTALLGKLGIDVNGKKAVILGTGGTSKTAYAALRQLGASEIHKVSRTPGEGVIDYAELYERHLDAQIIINTTPVGMYPDCDGMPISLEGFKSLSGVVDVIYNPLRTRLVLEAMERGIPAGGGLYMLVAQAVRASEIFRDKVYPEGVTDEIYDALVRDKESIVLIGMPSSGKSTVGARLAELLGREILDTDSVVVEDEGCTIPEIFKEKGEGYFRDAETLAVKKCAARGGVIVATGGGAVLRRENLTALRQNGRLYYLDRPLELLIPTSDRPLSSDSSALRKRYTERYPVYTAAADVRVDGSGSVEEVANSILGDFCK